ncbi:hypothetical protein CfE428DRAFT_4634 [Chthoniobacter flavus Ellin428]|uniref:Uncharacterized protein n=1 Tax=Chthoniobacter flavus Ellin428 TaxID=497964 RepID=B4D6U4_9BACT|nr:hypothetical protein [Chthoniobacter flavus]EDY17895.1 hypothetical protein CfE428DRAFT_4634 [Chthoniobacter flavus Ellin428]
MTVTPLLRRTRSRIWLRLLVWSFYSLLTLLPLRGADSARQTIAKAILEEDADKKTALINSLIGQSDPVIPVLLTSWKEDTIFSARSTTITRCP